MKWLISLIAFIGVLSTSLYAQITKDLSSPHKILVVSGGGARGAWGVGVVTTLTQHSGSYKAVYGTSTGSLMAPFILLQEYDTLESFYTGVKQSDIFSQNPFKIHYDKKDTTVKASLKNFKALKRFVFGKKTFGETKNLKALIKQRVDTNRYLRLLDACADKKHTLGIAVTNMRTGGMEMKYLDSGYKTKERGWDSLCNWIWASANEPLLMSCAGVSDTPCSIRRRPGSGST